jgi:hypothetical protein
VKGYDSVDKKTRYYAYKEGLTRQKTIQKGTSLAALAPDAPFWWEGAHPHRTYHPRLTAKSHFLISTVQSIFSVLTTAPPYLFPYELIKRGVTLCYAAQAGPGFLSRQFELDGLQPMIRWIVAVNKNVPTLPAMGLAAVEHNDDSDCITSQQKVTAAGSTVC